MFGGVEIFEHLLLINGFVAKQFETILNVFFLLWYIMRITNEYLFQCNDRFEIVLRPNQMNRRDAPYLENKKNLKKRVTSFSRFVHDESLRVCN